MIRQTPWIVIAVLLCQTTTPSRAFVVPRRTAHIVVTTTARFPLSSSPDKNDGNGGDGNNNDLPREEEMIGVPSYESSVDWDAEWKKVMEEQKSGQKTKASSSERPGQGYYKTEAEIKAIQTANKAAFQAQKVKASLPSWQMLKGDWKFWVAILAILSIGTSLLTANSMNVPPPDTGSGGGGGSYYI